MHCREKRISKSTLVEKFKHDGEISSGAKGTHTPSGRQRAGGLQKRRPCWQPSYGGSRHCALQFLGPRRPTPLSERRGLARPAPSQASRDRPAAPRRPDSLRMSTAPLRHRFPLRTCRRRLSLPPPAGVRAGRSPREAFPARGDQASSLRLRARVNASGRLGCPSKPRGTLS